MATDTPFEYRDLTIYSLFIRNFSEEGTFQAVEAELDRIKSLGTDIICFLPFYPIGEENRKGTIGSPYAIKDYRTIDPAHGTEADFLELVDAIHERDMKVMIDIVFNHTSPDSILAKKHPEWFFRKKTALLAIKWAIGSMLSTWTKRIKICGTTRLKYLSSGKKIVDGFRCDVAPLVPVEFWKQARAAVEEIKPDFIWLAETNHRGFVQEARRENILAQSDAEIFQAFDITYDYDVDDEFREYIEGKAPLSKYAHTLNLQDTNFPANFVKLKLVENHDHLRFASMVDDLNLYGHITPDDRKLKHFTVQIGTNGLRPVEGQIILVEITQFPRYHNEDMQGIATKIVGHKDDPGIDILAIAYKHGINPEFPEEVLEELEGRRDLRGQKIITIDGADAKDLDDAINVEKLDNGNYLLGVHIADVSHYVQEGTALDEEAHSRGTSSYLIDRVIPMLPQKLSNGICSLHPQVDRLTLSAEMEINAQGQTVRYEIYPSVISSYRRMTYKEVNQILEDEDPAVIKEHEDLHEMFLAMEELHNILEEKRVRQGAISFDTPELGFNLDDDGAIESIELVERGVGERMIESFMLAANETVATNYTKDDLPFLYRVHEQPDQAKMQNFIEFAAALGVEVRGKKEDISPTVLQGILDQVKGKNYEQVVSMLMLRSMQQARYDVRPLGHYGLATEFYSHFTAPIRLMH